jgi:type VI secretion system protein VasJ
VSDDSSAEQAIAEAKRLMRAAGEYWRGKDPKDPVGYRLPRLAAWMTLRQPPPSAGDGKTQIPPPQPADLLARLEGMLANAQFAGVLQEAEGRIGAAVLWLDLHRLTAQALDRMGADHAAAAAAVAAEVKALLLRMPTLPDLRFANDQPLASPETKAWIRDAVLAGGGDGGAAAPARAPAGGADDPLEAVRAEALQLARQKKLPEALGRLAGEARRAPRLRDRVRLELEAARICMEHGHHETALAQLEGLDDEVRRGGIEAWDPEVAGEVLRSLIACRQRAGAKTPEEAQRVRELLQRLSRLDVVAALELSAKR